jgi:hypothetical protein
MLMIVGYALLAMARCPAPHATYLLRRLGGGIITAEAIYTRGRGSVEVTDD